MERNHKISTHSPLMLPYLMLKYLKSEVYNYSIKMRPTDFVDN